MEVLSSFAFNFKLRRYSEAHLSVVAVHASAIASHPQLLAAQSAVVGQCRLTLSNPC
jgi:hypothetical protein